MWYYPFGCSFLICPAGWPVGCDWLLPGPVSRLFKFKHTRLISISLMACQPFQNPLQPACPSPRSGRQSEAPPRRRPPCPRPADGCVGRGGGGVGGGGGGVLRKSGNRPVSSWSSNLRLTTLDLGQQLAPCTRLMSSVYGVRTVCNCTVKESGFILEYTHHHSFVRNNRIRVDDERH